MSGHKAEDPRIHGIASSIRVVPNFPKPGIMFQDITTLLLDHRAFKNTVDLFVERYKGKNISVVAVDFTSGFTNPQSFEVDFYFWVHLSSNALSNDYWNEASWRGTLRIPPPLRMRLFVGNLSSCWRELQFLWNAVLGRVPSILKYNPALRKLELVEFYEGKSDILEDWIFGILLFKQ